MIGSLVGLGPSRKAVPPGRSGPFPTWVWGLAYFAPRRRSGSRQACHQSFSRHVDRTSPCGLRTVRAMKPTAWAASLLVSLLVTLMPITWASPVDPGWTKGIFDDGITTMGSTTSPPTHSESWFYLSMMRSALVRSRSSMLLRIGDTSRLLRCRSIRLAPRLSI